MKQITEAGKNYSKNAKVVAAVESFIRDMNSTADMTGCASHFRYATRPQMVADGFGRLALMDFATAADYTLTVWEHKGDTLVVPGFADEGWTSRTTKGQFFTLNANEEPVIED